jgi:hypothetical protein
MTDNWNTNFDVDPYDDEETLGNPSPVRVHVIKDSTQITSYTADYGGYQTYSIPQSTGGVATQILQRRPKRHRALIEIVSLGGATGVVFNKSPDPLLVPNGPFGYTLEAISTTREIKNQEPLYAVSLGGGPATISVLDESWD